MNKKYAKLRLFQSAFLMLLFLGLCVPMMAQSGSSGSGSNSGSQSNSNDCCDQGDKPGDITFRYVGGSCNSSDNSQGSKFECDGGSANNGSVYIIASKDDDGGGDRFFAGNVSLNQTFTIDDNGDKFGSKTFLSIYTSQGGSLLQLLNIHTSCSAPIVPGDQFGAVILESLRFQNGVSCSPPAPPEVCPTPTINTPTSTMVSDNGNFCINAPVVFSAPDLGFPCLAYTWNFGNDASPATFTGRGPVSVTYFSAGNRQVSLTIDNGCSNSNSGMNGGSGSSGSDNSGLGSDSDGSASGNSNDGTDSGSTSNGSSGTDSSAGGNNMTGAVICPSMPFGMGGNGSGSSGSDNSGSGSGSDSNGNGSNSNDGTDSGSTSNGSAGTDSSKDGSDNMSNCVPCRTTVTININVENCNQPNPSMIGDMVFNDLNGNGIMNNGEPGIQGVTVTLSKDNGQFIAQTTSDFFGKYKFNDVMPNMSYKLTYTNLPAGFSFAPQNQGNNEDNDSDANPATGMTDPIFINPGDMRLDQDVGLVQGNPNQASVGDKVFADNNGNGIQDGGEPGIGGVTVKLQDSNGNTLQQTTTDGSGNYTFTGLPQGLYKVMFNTPNGFTITMPKQGGNDATDSDVQADQMTNPFFVGEGQNLTTVDAGYVPVNPNNGTIGDKVFADNNNNGQQDNNEPGIGGVTVKLQDANGNTLQQTTTNGSGNYSFTGLPAGNYKIMFNTPAGFTQSPANVGNDATDSDNMSNQMTDPFFLGSGETNNTVDAGFVPDQPNDGASVGDKVFVDNNGDGVQDGNEPGIGGVTVKLQDTNGNTLQTTTTNSSGNYSFTGLDQGLYKVMFNTPNGFVITMPKQGGNEATDSDVQNNQMTNPFFLGEDQDRSDIDAGYIPDQPNNNASVGDKVFADNNNNGQQDNNEPGIGGVTVKLQDANGNTLQQTTTDGGGNYSFTGLAAGNYKVMFNTPAGFTQSPANVGNDATDSDNQSNQMTDPFFLAEGQNNPTIDAGFVPDQPNNNASVGDKVFADNNNNGQQDNGEPGIGGVTVKLQDTNGNTLQQMTTDGNGNYSFTGLATGNYKVMFNTPAGFTQSPANVGNDATDSDNQSNQMTDPFFLADGENNPTIDAGFVPDQPSDGASLGDKVFVDNDGDGVQNGGEPGISGVTVKLQDMNGNTLQTTTTNGSGNYIFTGLAQGLYKVMFNTPNGFAITTPKQGGNEETDSDVQTNQMTNPIFLGENQDRADIDAGYVPDQPNNNASVGDKVFADNNNNGQQDNGEPGIGGVTVKLQDTNGNTLQQTTTDGNGNYGFTGLASGNYKVMFNTPAGFTQSPANVGNDATDSDNQSNQMTDPFFLSDGENNPTIDAGFVPDQPNNNGSIGDKVFADTNGNGQQDGGEPGVGGVTVKLQDSNGNTLQTTTTDGNGNYQFSNVPQGSYVVMVNVPTNFNPSPMNVGNDATDSDIGPNGMTNVFFLNQGQNETTIDAGLVPQGNNGKACVGDFAFRDNNGNGIQDPGDTGVSGVYVQLNDANSNFVAFKITDQDGRYKFCDLDPGTYQLKMVGQPGDLIPSPQNEGSDDSKDSDINLLGFTDFFTLSAGDDNVTLDGGFSPRDAVPQSCEINATVSNIQCDGSTYSFDVTVNGSNTGDWGWDIGEFGITSQNYGSTRRISGVSGTKTILIIDHDVAGCETTITVNPPSGCGDTGSGTGTCADINISGSNGQVTVSGLTAAIEITKIFDASWNLIYECSGNCPNTVQESVSDGDYNVQVQFYTATWGFICEKQDRVTVGGGGDNGGGDNGGGNNGGGNSSGGDCDNINVQSGNGQITVSGWSAPVAIVKIFNPDYSLAKDCTGNNCTGPITASGLAAGRYHIDIQLYTAGWQAICGFTQDVNMGSSSLVAPNTAARLENSASHLSVYPNPATDELLVNLRAYAGQNGIIQVHNQIGQVVKQVPLDKIPTEAVRVSLDQLEGGLYYISAQVAGGGLMTQKVIIE